MTAVASAKAVAELLLRGTLSLSVIANASAEATAEALQLVTAITELFETFNTPEAIASAEKIMQLPINETFKSIDDEDSVEDEKLVWSELKGAVAVLVVDTDKVLNKTRAISKPKMDVDKKFLEEEMKKAEEEFIKAKTEALTCGNVVV